MKTEKLIEIAQELDFKDLVKDLQLIKKHEDSPTCPLVLPLVGEFSSGKTTLINALTDSKSLETATKPTTATIFEVHFGCKSCSAKVVYPDGREEVVNDIANLKNSELADSTVIEVYDTSMMVPPTTILVDTPGLSSPDPRHKQTLVDFLPHADAILMVADVNQQITRSMTEFVKDMELSKRRIFLVLTKADTKSKGELQAVKEYIGENIKLPLEQICCVSAIKGELDELTKLFAHIDKSKGQILKQVNQHRIEGIRKEMIKRIDDILASASSNEETEEALIKQQRILDKLNRNIDHLVESASSDIDDIQRDTTRNFEDRIFGSLDSLVASKCDNFDSQAISTINSISSLLLNDYKDDVRHTLTQLAGKQIGDDALDLRCLDNIDLSSYAISGISYNLNLNELGHEYDGMIATGTKIAGVAAAVVATAGVVAAGSAAAAGGAAATGGAATTATVAGEVATEALVGSKVIDVVDTVSDVGSIISNRKTARRVEKAISMAGKINEHMETVNNYEQRYSEQMGTKKGIVESMVVFVTDKVMGKPQRRRAIREYLDGTLMPQFKGELDRVSHHIVQSIRDMLKQDASETVNAICTSIKELKQMKETEQNQYEERMQLLRSYKKEITKI